MFGVGLHNPKIAAAVRRFIEEQQAFIALDEQKSSLTSALATRRPFHRFVAGSLDG